MKMRELAHEILNLDGDPEIFIGSAPLKKVELVNGIVKLHAEPFPNIPWEEIDSGIIPTVLAFNRAGFETQASCWGGEGHRFDLATICVKCISYGNMNRKRLRLIQWLLSLGIHGFTISLVCMYQDKEAPEDYSYIQVEFWDKEVLNVFSNHSKA